MREPVCTIESNPPEDWHWHARAESCAAMLDAIPDDVLAQLAIDRGAIVETGACYRLPGDDEVAERFFFPHVKGWSAGEFVPLYRLAADHQPPPPTGATP